MSSNEEDKDEQRRARGKVYSQRNRDKAKTASDQLKTDHKNLIERTKILENNNKTLEDKNNLLMRCLVTSDAHLTGEQKTELSKISNNVHRERIQLSVQMLMSRYKEGLEQLKNGQRQYLILQDVLPTLIDTDMMQYCEAISSRHLHEGRKLSKKLDPSQNRVQMNMPEAGFGQVYIEASDGTKKRLEYDYFTDIESILTILFARTHRAESSSLLKSLPGGTPQELHTDYEPDDFSRGVQFASIYCCQSASLKIECPTISGQRIVEVVEIPQNGIVIFRAEVKHAGNCFDMVKYRFHSYIRLTNRNQSYGGDGKTHVENNTIYSSSSRK